MIKIRKRERRERGQTLILVLVALPLFFALMALVVDGGNVLVHRRNIQVAADAAALAIAQNIDLASNPHTCGTYNGQTGNPACNALAAEYSSKNGVSTSIHRCNDADPTKPSDTNCWAYPYVDTSNVTHQDEVEVRLKAPVATFFVGAVNAMLNGGLSTTFHVSARAVAQTNQVLGVTTIPGQTFAGTTTVIPGETHITTDVSTISNGTGVAFAMSGVCNSISYTGSGSGTWAQAIRDGFPGEASVLGALATNGGVNFQGNTPKKITWLGFDQMRCMNGPNHDPDSPPSGDPTQCFARAWNTPPGNGTDSDNNCVQTLVNLNQTVVGQPWRPINWPLPPPTVPQPQTGAYDPASYPTKCSDVTSRKSGGGAGTVNVDVSNLTTWPEGIYCVTGGTSFQISGADPAASRGHTFFALGGGTISLSSNSTLLKYYWPASCGPRPQPNDPRQGCVPNYDPYTLLYATFASADGNCAICLQGQNGNITGDLFATQPNAFPPTPTQTQTGGTVKVAGGALAAGRGFIECWNLQLSGNTGTYQGTGAGIAIPGATHTTTDDGTTIINTGSVGNATTMATTLGTTLDLNE